MSFTIEPIPSRPGYDSVSVPFPHLVSMTCYFTLADYAAVANLIDTHACDPIENIQSYHAFAI